MLKNGLLDSDNRSSVDVTGARLHMLQKEGEELGNFVDLRKMITFVGACYFFLMTAWIVPVACVSTAIFIFPIAYFNLPLYNFFEHKLCAMVNAHWNTCAANCLSQITEFGTDLSAFTEEKCLLLANHLGLLDHFILMQSLNNKGSVRSRWMWVIYNIWKYTPLGVLWTSHGNFFVNGGASKRDNVLNSFRKHLENRFYKNDFGWIVMYPEGSRLYLVEKSGLEFAKKNELKPLDHCVYPRTGAAHAVLEVLGPQKGNNAMSNCGKGAPIKYIIDATLGYRNGVVPNLLDAAMGDCPNCEMAVHYDVIQVKEEWNDEKALRDFLYERYTLKDKMLGEYYKTGVFPGEKKKVTVNNWEMIGSQFFWVVLYYIHYLVWLQPLFAFIVDGLMSFVF